MGAIEKGADDTKITGHSPTVKARFTNWLLFALGFLKHPNRVGGMLPSSPFLVESVLKQVDWEEANVIVEYGAGLGAFTYGLLERMRPNAQLIAFEINRDFFQFLGRTFHDARLCLVHESATEVAAVLARLGLSRADYVISGIPFLTLPEEERELIVRNTYSVLRPNGKFLVYQFSGVVRPYLERVFGRVSRTFELLNILPARVFNCAR